MFTQGKGLLSRSDFLVLLIKKLPEFKKCVNNKKVAYYNIPSAFDIETTSFYDNGEKRGIMYHWQFGIYNMVTAGRTWDEYKALIKVVKQIMSLSNYLRLCVYVHNFQYEFGFIRKHFDWEEVFLLDNRKPVYANNYGIEYRCSYKLSNKSLDNTAKDLQKYKVNKAVGDLDYSKIRTPLTPLSDKELYYCEMDIRVLLSYIQEKIEYDGDITKIPLTNTGYVRQYCKKKCYERWKPYHLIMQQLTLDTDEYSQLKRAFRGGFTHANHNHSLRKTLKNVGSDDFTSSYPAVMVLEQFPMSKGILVKDILTEKQLSQLLSTKCCLFDFEAWGVIPIKEQEHPLSKSKCWKISGEITDNGRVVGAHYLATTITEQDYFTYVEFYTWDSCKISNFRYYEKGYLPRKFILAILELYQKKTTLKDVEGEEINYMISKNMLNSCYGMSVTDIIRAEYKYIEGTELEDGKITDFPKQEINVEEKIRNYNNSKNRFLFYPWGVWVTAYARANLFSGIIELGNDYIYSDTDSIKSLNRDKHAKYFNRYNQAIFEKIQKSSEYNRIPIEMYAPFNKKGKQKPIGVWDFEGIYTRFKTLGAKRYLTMKPTLTEKPNWVTFEEDGVIIDIENNMFQITLAGSNKKKTMDFLIKTGEPFKQFNNKLVIPSESSGRLLITYIDDETEGDIVDYTGQEYHYHELSSINMEPIEYHLSIDKLYLDYLEGRVDISE